jgi:peptide/nickel transport system permease protein
MAVALLGTSLALVNFGIDEFVNPRLRAAGLTRRRARRAGLPARFALGLTPVMRPAPGTGQPVTGQAVTSQAGIGQPGTGQAGIP